MVPKTYIAKWKLLQEWLADPSLKLQIESLVEFGRKAHEMPDTVLNWIQSLKAIKSDPYDFFSTQIWEAITILQDDDFENFVNGLVSGIDSALNSLKTWMGIRILNFAYSPNLPIYEFPLLYEFVKSRIYYIVIHQQQIEGLFNKYDLKSHPNMTNETKQAKLQLAFENTKNISLTISDLHEERKRKRKRMENINEDNSLNYGVEEVNRLFNELFVKKKGS
ncbi:unnamed protein product [Rhizophagus irregularis]|nr:unnamed protein product [Rhizophagus irregularis]